jgi:hypothetical protein
MGYLGRWVFRTASWFRKTVLVGEAAVGWVGAGDKSGNVGQFDRRGFSFSSGQGGTLSEFCWVCNSAGQRAGHGVACERGWTWSRYRFVVCVAVAVTDAGAFAVAGAVSLEEREAGVQSGEQAGRYVACW